MKPHWIIFLLSYLITAKTYLRAQPLLQVFSEERSETLLEFTQLYLKELELTGDFGLIVEETSEMPASLDGLTLADPIKHASDFDYYRVLIRANLKEPDLLVILAHEMIHLKQMVIDKLKIINSRKVRWNGKTYFIRSRYNRTMPWEKEAFELDLDLFRVAVEHLEERHRALAALENRK